MHSWQESWITYLSSFVSKERKEQGDMRCFVVPFSIYYPFFPGWCFRGNAITCFLRDVAPKLHLWIAASSKLTVFVYCMVLWVRSRPLSRRIPGSLSPTSGSGRRGHIGWVVLRWSPEECWQDNFLKDMGQVSGPVHKHPPAALSYQLAFRNQKWF